MEEILEPTLVLVDDPVVVVAVQVVGPHLVRLGGRRHPRAGHGDPGAGAVLGDVDWVAPGVGVPVVADVAAAASLPAQVSAGGPLAALGHAAAVLLTNHPGRVVVAPLPAGPLDVSVLPGRLEPESKNDTLL